MTEYVSSNRLGLVFTAILLACGSMIGCSDPPIDPIDLVESFDGNSYDRSRWQLATPNAAVAKVEIQNDGLLMTAPPGTAARPQIRNNGKFTFDGDFQVSMDYELVNPLPTPDKDYINLEIILFGTDSTARISRVNHKGSGEGVVVYVTPMAKSKKSVWKHSPTKDRSGTLKLERRGENVFYSFIKENSSEPVRVASAPMIGPVHNLCIALSIASPTKEPIKVRVDNIEVHSKPVAGSNRGTPLAWFAALLLIGLAASGVWIWKTGKFVARPK